MNLHRVLTPLAGGGGYTIASRKSGVLLTTGATNDGASPLRHRRPS